MSLKKIVFKFAVIKIPNVTKIAKFNFSLVFSFEIRAAHMGDKRLKIDNIPPINPAPIVLAKISL